MRIYISDGRVYVELDETIEICRFNNCDTLQRYKEELLEKISKRFDLTVAEAALRGMETPVENPKKPEKSKETVSKQPETVSKQPETASEPQESETNQQPKLFRAPKDGKLQPEVKKTRQKIDYGKIMALHNAGWSNQKIADEMGMTYGAVATAISTYKKKVGGGKA
ncbi:MAG: hypothetical protein J1F42_01770 [Lachnospiraceae bacterium]|nr:hypothetical protein [Lachnospiraceae bacterium]